MAAGRQGEWWKNAVFYQIYPKSFQDTNGDGIGDLEGIIQRLDYLAWLGIDGVWLSAVNESPQKDNGYDVSDYYGIAPMLGTVEDMDRLIAEADRRGLIVIMDLVINHTSDQHAWFRQARQGRDNPFHDFYIWRDGTEDAPPDDGLTAEFGGSAWIWDQQAGQYYYSTFSPYQPDLNWDNPRVREEMHKMMRFWIDKGIGGFRIDAIPFISKDLANGVAFLGPHLHEYVQEMREKAFPDPAFFTTGEDGLCEEDDAALYTDPSNGELSAIFEFAQPDIGPDEWSWEMKWSLHPLNLRSMKRRYQRWQTSLGDGWTTPCVGNHDTPRANSWWGAPEECRPAFSKTIGAMLLGLRGTPFIYQGEEIGMTSIRLPIEEHVDLDTIGFYRESEEAGRDMDEIMERIHINSRDNARTPMQWTGGEHAGFSSGQAKPWMPVNPDYVRVNVAAQLDDPDSVLGFFRKMIHIRKIEDALLNGAFELLDPESDKTFCYARATDRERVIVAANFSGEEQEWPEPADTAGSELLLSNYEPATGALRPYEVRVIKEKLAR